jgi:hypothetical protein
MKDGAMRFVMSPAEASAWVKFLLLQGRALPQWALDWDGESSVWLDEYES